GPPCSTPEGQLARPLFAFRTEQVEINRAPAAAFRRGATRLSLTLGRHLGTRTLHLRIRGGAKADHCDGQYYAQSVFHAPPYLKFQVDLAMPLDFLRECLKYA